MRVVPATAAHIDAWAKLRADLWPDDDAAGHRTKIGEILPDADPKLTAIFAVDHWGVVQGFAERSLRHDYVASCDSSEVVYLEGICGRPEARRTGVARMLSAAVGECSRARGCTEYASDAIVKDEESHRFHAAIGFAEVERVVCFKKEL